MTDYDKQAEEFLTKTNTRFKVEFVEYGRHFDDDKESRDIYLITLTTSFNSSMGKRSFSFRFGQSINCSGKFISVYHHEKCPRGFRFHSKGELEKARGCFIGQGRFYKENKDFREPTAYDVLTCLTKYDPGTLEDFCGEFGYDTDSRKAEKTYQAVLNEYNSLKMLYSDSELEELQEIN